jgi:hypothetical protein
VDQARLIWQRAAGSIINICGTSVSAIRKIKIILRTGCLERQGLD